MTNVMAREAPAYAKQECRPCGGDGLVWVRRDNRWVQTKCGNCNGEGEL